MSGIIARSIDKRIKLYPSLREMCLDHRFWPYQQLHIEDIATRFSASTTPVREALARLAGEGLIESVPNRGYFARNVSLDETRCRLDILFLLLQHALRTCSLPDAGKEAKVPVDTAIAPSAAGMLLANRTYLSIASMSGYGVLTPEIERQLDLTRLVRSIDLENPARLAQLHASLAELRAHLENDDKESASLCLCRQHEDLRSRLHEIVQEAQLRMLMEISSSARRAGAFPR
ncbi:GntR family transcriptional regulator [Rhizobium sp. BK602]|uniref:GntR family transcriptional regulator n=1 Tax=Rhizobium sp. BK602 TaxID=2586986 RepID=UPI0016095A1D|nr:DNA-binding GntR family transcriptional regulator [Rhizobium sp. BK602]